MPQPTTDPCDRRAHKPSSRPALRWTVTYPGARRRAPARRRAFTMIELLVVIGIIAILVGLLVIVGSRVAGTGKQSATLSVIKALDATMGAVVQERGRLPRAVVRDPRSPASGDEYWPIADASSDNPPTAENRINSAGWFLQLASEMPGSSDLTGLDPELLRPYSPTVGTIGSTPDTTQPMLTTPMDGWGNPIRFVHPDYDGSPGRSEPWDLEPEFVFAQVFRVGWETGTADPSDPAVALLNADGGFAPGNQPYFYSTGPDGKAGVVLDSSKRVVQDFNADNVYGAVPEFDRPLPN